MNDRMADQPIYKSQLGAKCIYWNGGLANGLIWKFHPRLLHGNFSAVSILAFFLIIIQRNCWFWFFNIQTAFLSHNQEYHSISLIMTPRYLVIIMTTIFGHCENLSAGMRWSWTRGGQFSSCHHCHHWQYSHHHFPQYHDHHDHHHRHHHNHHH